MAISQPASGDKQSTPDHSLMHRQIATDPSAAVKTIVVDSSSNTGIGTETPTSKLHIEGSVTYAYVAKTGTYILTASDYQIECTANSFTLTLPTAVGIAGRVYSIKNSGSGTITVDGDGTETIDEELTQLLNQFDNLKIMSNGANWIVI